MDITFVTIETCHSLTGQSGSSFAHGSGSPRNHAVAAELNRAWFGTLLLDLFTTEEEQRDLLTAEHRFDGSGPAPALRALWSGPWYLAAAAPTWPDPPCNELPPRCSSSWAAMTCTLLS